MQQVTVCLSSLTILLHSAHVFLYCVACLSCCIDMLTVVLTAAGKHFLCVLRCVDKERDGVSEGETESRREKDNLNQCESEQEGGR